MKVLATKSVVTKSAVAPVVVSSKPSNLAKSIQQTLSGSQVLLNMLGGLQKAGYEQCAPLIQSFNNLIAAPAYDVTGQSANAQQAYTLYQSAIDRLNAQASVLRSCGQSGSGTIQKDVLNIAYRETSEVTSLLTQAWDLIRYEPGVSSSPSVSTSLQSIIRQAMYTTDQLARIRDRITSAPYTLDYIFPIHARQFPCGDYDALYNLIAHAPTQDVNSLTSNVQTAYSMYRQAIAKMMDTAKPIMDACSDLDNGLITLDMNNNLKRGASVALDIMQQALNLLNQ
jgi:hypothetical protein